VSEAVTEKERVNVGDAVYVFVTEMDCVAENVGVREAVGVTVLDDENDVEIVNKRVRLSDTVTLPDCELVTVEVADAELVYVADAVNVLERELVLDALLELDHDCEREAVIVEVGVDDAEAARVMLRVTELAALGDTVRVYVLDALCDGTAAIIK
jgi:hypothetical protein